jgi:hypothetical protein
VYLKVRVLFGREEGRHGSWEETHNTYFKLGAVVHTIYGPSTQEAEAGRFFL